MKTLILLPLFGAFLMHIQSKPIHTTLKDSDTITIIVNTPAHECKFVDCPFKGQYIFQPEHEDDVDLDGAEHLHFLHPEWGIKRCLKEWEKQINTVNL